MKITTMTTKTITVECDYTQIDAVEAFLTAQYGGDLIKERCFQPPMRPFYIMVFKVYSSEEREHQPERARGGPINVVVRANEEKETMSLSARFKSPFSNLFK